MKSPFTPEEQLVQDNLVSAFNAFSKLESTHSDEHREFCDAIHVVQNILAWRILRRDYPETFHSINDSKHEHNTKNIGRYSGPINYAHTQPPEIIGICMTCANRSCFDSNVEIRECKRYCTQCGVYVSGPRIEVKIITDKPTITTKK